MTDDEEILDKESLLKLSKDQIIDYTLKVTNFASLAKTVESLSDRLKVVEANLAIASNINNFLKDRVSYLENHVSRLDRTTIDNSQYLRNKQIEVRVIPDEIIKLPTADLKTKMAELFSLTGETITSQDIGRCHPLGANQQSVILEFYDREKRDSMLRSRKNLKDKKEAMKELNTPQAIIVESLCREYARLDFVCRKLKKNNVIKDTWFFNGKLFIKLSEHSAKEKVSHINDIIQMVGQEQVDLVFQQRNK